ncbi:MAG: hypothetical protein HY686_07525 [Chloroflexi bacterium]|nr:hypothetical protein [Chloroflexota bacterium]
MAMKTHTEVGQKVFHPHGLLVGQFQDILCMGNDLTGDLPLHNMGAPLSQHGPSAALLEEA